MKIGGLQKLSLIDFPRKLAAVVFTQGCSFRCHFCHNKTLVLPQKFSSSLCEKEFFSFLLSRQKKLDGVVISGGEPTMHKDLVDFITKIKNLSFSVKLDTSGTHPNMLHKLLEKKLIDYVAMDIKAPFDKYQSIINVAIDIASIKESISLLLNSSIDYEFRTTLVPSLHAPEDIVTMAKQITSAPLYILQKFLSHSVLNPKLQGTSAYKPEELELYRQQAEQYVKKCIIR